MKEGSRIEQIFEALKRKVPVTEINKLLNTPQQALSAHETNNRSEVEKKVARIIAGLQAVESIEKPIIYGRAQGNNEADFIVKAKKEDGFTESLTVIVRPGRGGIRRYRKWFRDTYNLDLRQVDEFLKMKKIILINGGSDALIIEESFLRQLKGI